MTTPVDDLSGTQIIQKVVQKCPKIKGSEGRKTSLEMTKHVQNFEIVLRCSNATPTRGYQGIGFGCYFCKVQFPDAANLKSHTLECHADLRHSSATRPPQLNNYSVKLDITSLTCKICSDKFDQLIPLMDHLRSKHHQPIHTDIKSCILPLDSTAIR